MFCFGCVLILKMLFRKVLLDSINKSAYTNIFKHMLRHASKESKHQFLALVAYIKKQLVFWQAAGSNTSTFVEYIQAQLDLDASRRSKTFISRI